MIIDLLGDAEKYFCVHPLFEQAFEYIRSQDLESMEAGRHEIEAGRLWAIIISEPGTTAAESGARFECHNQHIDIQLCIHGTEQIGWKPRQACMQEKGEYSEEADVQLYNDAPDMYFKLKPLQFAVFFPEDVHAPMIGEEKIRKMVVKVKV